FVAEHQKRFGTPPDFFTAGGFAAASAALTAVDKAGGTEPEKLIAAMEGMTFETPKGPITFRKEDHPALQVMYHFKVKANGRDGSPSSWPPRGPARPPTPGECPASCARARVPSSWTGRTCPASRPRPAPIAVSGGLFSSPTCFRNSLCSKTPGSRSTAGPER